MQARYYDPVVGRFMAVDPVGFAPANPMSFNRYLYVNNNPYRYLDPNGRNYVLAWDLGSKAGATAGAFIGGPVGATVGYVAGGVAVVALAYAGSKYLGDSIHKVESGDDSESAGEKIRNGKEPARGRSGERGELEGSDPEGDWGSIEGVDGEERTEENGTRVKPLSDGGTAETHESTKNPDYAQGTRTIKIRDTQGRVVVTVRYPKSNRNE